MSHPCPSVTSLDDEAVDDYRDLRSLGSRQADQRADHFIAEGPIAIHRLIEHGRRPRSILALTNKVAKVREITTVAGHTDTTVPVHSVTAGLLEELTGFDLHRGLLASFHRPTPTSASNILEGIRGAVLAEQVTDPENVGAIFRTAAAFGLETVLLDQRCPDPLYRRCVRVSQGWSALMANARVTSAAEGVRQASAGGFRTVALAPHRHAMVVDEAAGSGVFEDPFLLIVGAEATGISKQVLEQADVRIQIPMSPGVDSLNVASALAVVASFAAASRGWTD